MLQTRVSWLLVLLLAAHGAIAEEEMVVITNLENANAIDRARLYDRALTPEEVAQTSRIETNTIRFITLPP